VEGRGPVGRGERKGRVGQGTRGESGSGSGRGEGRGRTARRGAGVGASRHFFFPL